MLDSTIGVLNRRSPRKTRKELTMLSSQVSYECIMHSSSQKMVLLVWRRSYALLTQNVIASLGVVDLRGVDEVTAFASAVQVHLITGT